MQIVVTQFSLTSSQLSRHDVMPRGALLLTFLAVPALLLTFLALTVAPALAAPSWGIEMSHVNAYGAQAASCPGGHESLPGEPDCGVDPNTGSGTTFSRESGFNTYTIKVKNTAQPASGPAVGETLLCSHGTWEGGPTFAYHWLRNGTVIAEGSDEYTIVAADEGKAIQCEVTGTNVVGSGDSAVTNALAVSPPSSTALPALEKGSEAEVKVAKESSIFNVGETLKCAPGSWTGSPTFAYHWLRNGTVITEAGAESDEYKVTTADKGTSLQCEVTATNAGGSVVGENRYFTMVESGEEPPYVAEGNPGPSLPSSASTNEITGPVTVADQLPDGLVLAGPAPAVSGAGWRGGAGEGSCMVASGATGFTCTTSKPLAPGESYPPITVHVRVSGEAPVGSPPSGGVTNTAAVSGGGAATALASDATTIAPAVPFGIQSLTTSVTEALGNPFTQAGGHPFAANATFVFNYTSSNEGQMQTAGGSPKDIETELPPGFVGDPQNATRCTDAQVQQKGEEAGARSSECPAGSVVGFVTVDVDAGRIEGGVANPFPANFDTYAVFNVEPSPGYPAAFAFISGNTGAFFAINAKLRSDGNYGLTIGDSESGRLESHGVQALSLTLCSYGVTGHTNEGVYEVTPSTAACAPSTSGAKPFLTNPTQCTGPAPVTTLRADTYPQPADYVSKTVYAGTNLVGGAPSTSESFVTGCNDLQFAPEVEFKPSSPPEGGTTQADEPTGATFNLKVPQTNEAGANATPELKSATVTLPEGMTVDPSAADGLQACSNAQFGLGSTVEPAEPAACPLASQVGTVKVTTPLLEKPLEGQVFLGEPECSPCSATDAEDGHIFRLFLQVRSAERGVTLKLAGHVSANPTTGRLQATFTQQPQLPFSELLLTFNGGARAPLANPQTCGTFTTATDLTPWSTSGLGGLSGTEAIAGTPDATPSSSFNVDWNGAGGACPASLPFSPSFSAGSQTPTGGASSPFSVTFRREDREQDISAITVSTPPGLLGKIAGIPQCPEAQANAGTCGPESQIGTTTVGAGPGPDPFYLSGKVYLTGPYKGAPFGLSIVVPAVAGPFNLGTVVVRASIAVNPATAALTITSDALPQFVDGVQLRLRKINVEVNRPGFMLNPTSCAQQAVGATITAAQGASSTQSTPFQVGACQSLPFAPKLTASAGGHASKAGGASLDVKIESAGVGQANIAKVDLQLPTALPSRLSTLQKACLAAVFNANPAACHEESVIGKATIHTPILKAPLTGPAYLVSHGGAAFPDVEFVLQGEGVTLILDGNTDIKNGITYSRFESAPDAPFTSFETELPTGPHSILGAYVPASANYNLCGTSLAMPTIITAQNGKQIKQTTKIAVTGCTPAKPSVKITKTKLKGNTLLVTVKTSANGTITISGSDLKTTTKKNVKAGSHQITVALSKAGKTAKTHRKKTKLRASLTAGKQAAATTISVKL